MKSESDVKFQIQPETLSIIHPVPFAEQTVAVSENESETDQIPDDSVPEQPQKALDTPQPVKKRKTAKQLEADRLRRLEEELKPQLEVQIRTQLEHEIRAALQQELKPGLEAEIREQLTSRIQAELETERLALRQQLELEIRPALQRELKPLLEAEIRDSLKLEIQREQKAETKPSGSPLQAAEQSQKTVEANVSFSFKDGVVHFKMEIKNVVEAILFAADKPMTAKQIRDVYPELERPDLNEIEQALAIIAEDYANRSVGLQKLASGYRFQVKENYAYWVGRLFEEKPPRYSRALLETIAIIAYRQPVTRGDIEDIRGVSVSSNMIRTLLERGWVRVIGYKEVPGRPAIYETTRQFLDYFNLSSLDQLPPLDVIKDLDLTQFNPNDLTNREQQDSDIKELNSEKTLIPEPSSQTRH